ncbi:SMP-30/gluconolactonase/LRE family protein [Actinomarinicola tropica]|uniref:Gluconolactonase n=1 Tax=Actinomarinicola tropica TaxID=2789776 RepID=A0A5Q2RMJ3_9ACTN|nr:SMP-30/gluconolactonase/LRE family protein [Actinomarinicola tropica]QGG95636.1 gluconolactonase [Actinomarinicola tropica]
MADRTFETLFEGGTFFEGPRWRDGRWWVSDFYSGLVRTITPEGDVEEVLHLDTQPSGLGWMPDGTLLVVSMVDRTLRRLERDGTLSIHADLSDLATGHLNDMVVDDQGRAYVGNFGFDLMGGGEARAADLVRVDPDGTATVVAGDLMFPNGSVITPDGRTLIVGETMGFAYTAFTIDADGGLSDRRTWASVEGVSPDGCALDADGQIWAADAMANRVVRVTEGGRITEEIPAPDGLGIYACMLGGPDGRTLLCCAAPDFFEQNRRHTTEAVLLTVGVDVPHAGLP